ncbi:MAG TPA: GNAT family N-acetyltransferase [Acidimicrobiales bacterium]|nr:GNAT family N-acetyltransferase [Acidimicrobiales bacterium]
MIRLVPISDQDLKVWLTAMWTDYRAQLLGTGLTSEEASLNIEQNEKALFVDGAPNDDQRIFDVMDNETKVGTLWLATREERSAGEWFVYDIVIDEEFRGKGFGRSTMKAAEDYVKSQGGTRLALNVFGPNAVARGLYESLEYKIMNIGMRKDLV